MDIKVGDRVKLRYFPKYTLISKYNYEGEGTVRSVKVDRIAVAFDNGYMSGPMDAHLFKIIKEEKRMKSEKVEHKNSWSFNIASLSQINWAEIADCATYKNPILLVDINPFYYVVVNPILREKAESLGIDPPKDDFDEHGAEFVDFLDIVPLNNVNEFKDWVAWAKKVKKAPWPIKFKTEVKVSVPSI